MLMVIVLLSDAIPFLIQFGLYKLTKKKFAAFFIPIACAILTIYLFVKSNDGVNSILSPSRTIQMSSLFLKLTPNAP